MNRIFSKINKIDKIDIISKINLYDLNLVKHKTHTDFLPRLLIVGLWVGLSWGGMQRSFASTPAERYLKAADEIRNPSESFEMDLTVKDGDGNESSFVVYLKGKDQTLIVTKSPARDRGRNMLMLDRDFHVYVPNLKRTMRLSLAQKLSGPVSNGDIARTRWFGDYTVTEEGTAKGEVRLYLKAQKDNLTYAAIRLWIEKATNRPLRAEYLGSNGKTILKKAYFEKYQKMEGALRPSLLRIEDVGGHSSEIIIQAMRKKKYTDSFFSLRNVETLR